MQSKQTLYSTYGDSLSLFTAEMKFISFDNYRTSSLYY